jgi:hypothetical protein
MKKTTTPFTMSTILNFQNNGGGDSSDNDVSGSSDNSSGDDLISNPYVEAIFCYGWVLVLFYCVLCKRGGSRVSTEVGDRIRQRAREYNQQMQRQKVKEAQTPQERKKLVEESLQTKRVISKNDQGNLTLGDVERKGEDAVAMEKGENTCNEKGDIETGNSSAQGPTPSITEKSCNNDGEVDDPDEDQICVICLDLFVRGDAVSWSRHNETCTHVFHTDCIRPWLEEKRQDECPSCRSTLICYPCDAESEEKDGEKPKDDMSDSFFVIVHGLISRAVMPRINHPPSIYNLVSVNSNSFDSQDVPQEDQGKIELPPLPTSRAASDSTASPNPTQPVELRHAVSDFSSLRQSAEV